MKPVVGIVIVNYNGESDVLRCVESLKLSSYKNFAFVVVDSASPDGEGMRLREALREFQGEVILSPRNDGFAAACNLGIAHFRATGADYIWLLNPDTEIHEDALSALVQCLESDPTIKACTSKILYPSSNGESRIWGAGGRVDFSSHNVWMIGSGEVDLGQFSEQCECDYLPGCSLIFRSEMVKTVGYFPEEYFMYFEETDWCTRARLKKMKLVYVPTSIVIHRFVEQKMNTPFTIYYYNRNQLIFWFKFSDLRQKIKQSLPIIFSMLPEVIIAIVRAPNEDLRAVFRAHAAAYFDALLFAATGLTWRRR